MNLLRRCRQYETSKCQQPEESDTYQIPIVLRSNGSRKQNNKPAIGHWSREIEQWKCQDDRQIPSIDKHQRWYQIGWSLAVVSTSYPWTADAKVNQRLTLRLATKLKSRKTLIIPATEYCPKRTESKAEPSHGNVVLTNLCMTHVYVCVIHIHTYTLCRYICMFNIQSKFLQLLQHVAIMLGKEWQSDEDVSLVTNRRELQTVNIQATNWPKESFRNAA